MCWNTIIKHEEYEGIYVTHIFQSLTQIILSAFNHRI